MESEEHRKLRQQEYCKNDVHDWKHSDPTHRKCKECGKEQHHEEGKEWVNDL